MRDKRIIVEIVIALLLIFSTWSYTRYYRNEQVLNLQLQFQQQTNGITATTNILNRGIQNGGKIDLQALVNLGWNLNVQPAQPKPDNKNNPSK